MRDVKLVFLVVLLSVITPGLGVHGFTNWTQVNQDGFGYGVSGKPTKLFVFGGALYAYNDNGLFRYTDPVCMDWERLPIPTDWEQLPAPYLHDGWRFVPLGDYLYLWRQGKLWYIKAGVEFNQANWQQVSSFRQGLATEPPPGYPVTPGTPESLPLPDGNSPKPWIVFNGQVYGEFWDPATEAFSVMRSGDLGKQVMYWEEVVSNSFGFPTDFAEVGFIGVAGAKLYVGLNTRHSSFAIYPASPVYLTSQWTECSSAIWESSSGDPGSWKLIKSHVPDKKTRYWPYSGLIRSWGVYSGSLVVGFNTYCNTWGCWADGSWFGETEWSTGDIWRSYSNTGWEKLSAGPWWERWVWFEMTSVAPFAGGLMLATAIPEELITIKKELEICSLGYPIAPWEVVELVKDVLKRLRRPPIEVFLAYLTYSNGSTNIVPVDINVATAESSPWLKSSPFDPHSSGVSSLAVFQGRLYAAVRRPAALGSTTGDQVWAYPLDAGYGAGCVELPDLTWVPPGELPVWWYYSPDATDFTLKLKNEGEAPTGTATWAQVYLDDELAYEGSIPELAPGEETEVTFSYPLSPGDHTIVMVADAEGMVRESDEENNALTYRFKIEGEEGEPELPGTGVAAEAVPLCRRGESHRLDVTWYLERSCGSLTLSVWFPDGTVQVEDVTGKDAVQVYVDFPAGGSVQLTLHCVARTGSATYATSVYLPPCR